MGISKPSQDCAKHKKIWLSCSVFLLIKETVEQLGLDFSKVEAAKKQLSPSA
ncbi:MULTISPECIES: DUF2999 family protein [Shewanella]|uniref:DUF2999 family protein n=1 Tax=Shewanella TaxID=22 RepID=UPI000EBF994F|nr:hypothetical protein [Shewanella sp.]